MRAEEYFMGFGISIVFIIWVLFMGGAFYAPLANAGVYAVAGVIFLALFFVFIVLPFMFFLAVLAEVFGFWSEFFKKF
ncbi:MAG: hypothetical protein ACTTIC_02910 [Helicobacteraceae bacterium]